MILTDTVAARASIRASNGGRCGIVDWGTWPVSYLLAIHVSLYSAARERTI